MTTLSGVSTPVPPRRRRGPAGRQILDATEHLLQSHPLSDLSVDRICAEAGVSRATYYHYFGSRTAPLTRLSEELWERVFAEIQPFVDSPSSPADTIRSSFKAAWQVWVEHSAVFRALADNWRSDPELTTLWVSIIDRFTTAIASEIDRERAAGAAPAGPPSRELASVLLWSTAHCLAIAGAGVDPNMPSEQGLYDTIIDIWLRSVYGSAPD
jgi:AcrR family transcriptional regulator